MGDGVDGDGLRELHREAGAEIGPLPGGGEGVRRFGDVAAEYAALTERCALIDRSWMGLIEVTGEDRQRFLNGLATRDVKMLEPGQGVYGFFTQQKGQVVSDAVIRVLGSSIRLETAPDRAAELLDHLSRYVVADRVEIEESNPLVPLTLAGPEVAAFMAELPISTEGPAAAGSFIDEGAPWRHMPVELVGRRLGLSVDGGLGVPAFTFWADSGEAAGLWEELLELGGDRGMTPAGFEALDQARIAAGVPWFGRDFGPDNLPQESGLETVVDYDKGCYLGQEVVARLHYRGQANRMVRRVELGGGEAPQSGEILLLEGREAGRLTGCGRPTAEGPTPGLAMVQRRAMDEGTRLATDGGARVEVLGPPTAP